MRFAGANQHRDNSKTHELTYNSKRISLHRACHINFVADFIDFPFMPCYDLFRSEREPYTEIAQNI